MCTDDPEVIEKEKRYDWLKRKNTEKASTDVPLAEDANHIKAACKLIFGKYEKLAQTYKYKVVTKHLLSQPEIKNLLAELKNDDPYCRHLLDWLKTGEKPLISMIFDPKIQTVDEPNLHGPIWCGLYSAYILDQTAGHIKVLLDKIVLGVLEKADSNVLATRFDSILNGDCSNEKTGISQRLLNYYSQFFTLIESSNISISVGQFALDPLSTLLSLPFEVVEPIAKWATDDKPYWLPLCFSNGFSNGRLHMMSVHERIFNILGPDLLNYGPMRPSTSRILRKVHQPYGNAVISDTEIPNQNIIDFDDDRIQQIREISMILFTKEVYSKLTNPEVLGQLMIECMIDPPSLLNGKPAKNYVLFMHAALMIFERFVHFEQPKSNKDDLNNLTTSGLLKRKNLRRIAFKELVDFHYFDNFCVELSNVAPNSDYFFHMDDMFLYNVANSFKSSDSICCLPMSMDEMKARLGITSNKVIEKYMSDLTFGEIDELSYSYREEVNKSVKQKVLNIYQHPPKTTLIKRSLRRKPAIDDRPMEKHLKSIDEKLHVPYMKNNYLGIILEKECNEDKNHYFSDGILGCALLMYKERGAVNKKKFIFVFYLKRNFATSKKVLSQLRALFKNLIPSLSSIQQTQITPTTDLA
jgi:hypothetical protein